MSGPRCLFCEGPAYVAPKSLGVASIPLRQGFAIECLLCKSVGPFADSPEQALRLYVLPWKPFSESPPPDAHLIVWDAEFSRPSATSFSPERHTAKWLADVQWTHWLMLSGPDQFPTVPHTETDTPDPMPTEPPVDRDSPDFDDEIPF